MYTYKMHNITNIIQKSTNVTYKFPCLTFLRFNQNYSCQTGLKQILEFRTSFQQYFYLAYLVDFFWTKHVTTAELLEKETEAFLIWPCKKEQHSWFRIFGFLFYTKILEHWKNSNLLLHSHRVIDVSMSIQRIIMQWIINQLKGFFSVLL